MPKKKHVYWETDGTPYTPQDDGYPSDYGEEVAAAQAKAKADTDLPLSDLCDLVEKLMREADEQRERTRRLIVAFATPEMLP